MLVLWVPHCDCHLASHEGSSQCCHLAAGEPSRIPETIRLILGKDKSQRDLVTFLFFSTCLPFRPRTSNGLIRLLFALGSVGYALTQLYSHVSFSYISWRALVSYLHLSPHCIFFISVIFFSRTCSPSKLQNIIPFLYLRVASCSWHKLDDLQGPSSLKSCIICIMYRHLQLISKMLPNPFGE